MRIRLTPEERAKVDAAALQLALGASSFARMVTVKAAGGKAYAAPRRRADAHSVALATWTDQLAQVGKTVDELVKTRNAGFDVAQLDVTEIREALSALRAAVLEFNANDETRDSHDRQARPHAARLCELSGAPSSFRERGHRNT